MIDCTPSASRCEQIPAALDLPCIHAASLLLLLLLLEENRATETYHSPALVLTHLTRSSHASPRLLHHNIGEGCKAASACGWKRLLEKKSCVRLASRRETEVDVI